MYCGKCGLLPEYCEWSPKQFDIEECKKWLAAENKVLYDKLYPVQEAAEATGEETKAAPQKKKKSVKIHQDKKIRCIKLKRGGKKLITNIVGFELFGCNLQEIARMLGKKLGTGAAVITVEHKELNCEGIQI